MDLNKILNDSNLEITDLASLLSPRLNEYIKQKPTAKQAIFLILPHKDAFFGGSAGPGKAGRLDSAIWTPFGPTTMGDLKLGSLVCNPDGTISKVINVIDRGKLPTFRVSTSDGASTVVSGDHLWLHWIAGKNMKAARLYLPDETPIRARIATTDTLREYLAVMEEGARPYWPLIPLTKPVTFTKSYKYDMRPIDPYLLGVLLGDGSFSQDTVAFCSDDAEVVEMVKAALPEGDSIRQRNREITYGIAGTRTLNMLRKIGVFGQRAWEKHIPEPYLYNSVEGRLALLQGLMDTDGTVSSTGDFVSFTSTSEQLAKDVQFLARSLGAKARITNKAPFYYDEDGGQVDGRPAYNVNIGNGDEGMFFRLPRKKDRCRKVYNGGLSSMGRRIVSIEPEGVAECRCITVDHPNGLYLTDDFIVTHNSSGLLMAALQYVDMPTYSAIIFRKTYSDLTKPGALMDRASEWLSKTPARWNGTDKIWRFPSGAQLAFGHMEHEKDRYNYQGAEFNFIGFDELTQFESKPALYLFSRLRRVHEEIVLPSRFRAASNPGGVGHEWVYERYIKEPRDPSRAFVPASMEDNPYLDHDDYLANLSNLDPVEQAQLISGDWLMKSGGLLFRDSSWFPILDDLNEEDIIAETLFWDLAATVPKKGNNPDFTVGVWMVETVFGVVIKEVWRMQGSPYEVEQFVAEKTAEFGRYNPLFIEQEPGAAGVAVIDHYRRNVLKGYSLRASVPTIKKSKRINPFAAAAQNGLVWLLRGLWNRAFLVEAFLYPDGSHDDQIDAASGAYNELMEGKPKVAGITRDRLNEDMIRRTATGIVIPSVSDIMERTYSRSSLTHSWGNGSFRPLRR